MNKIQIKVLNPEVVSNAEKMMVCAARLTQRGHKIKNLQDFMALYEKEYKSLTVEKMAKLPHPTIQKFGVINIVVVGASRRFLAQITRHQNEVKFMSASLQYSDYSDFIDFVVPYKLLGDKAIARAQYLESCRKSMNAYKDLCHKGLNNDSAGYLAPQGLRNVLIISATPYQWKHMISQRICRRNTDETRYVMLKIYEELYKLSASLFSCGPFCMQGACKEGDMCCGHPISATKTPSDILREDFPLLFVNKQIFDIKESNTLIEDFQAHFPKAVYREDGTPTACARLLGYQTSEDYCKENQCRVCWRRTLEEVNKHANQNN